MSGSPIMENLRIGESESRRVQESVSLRFGKSKKNEHKSTMESWTVRGSECPIMEKPRIGESESPRFEEF